MAFTDEDLKALVQRVARHLDERKYEVTFNIEEIQELLIRLGTAEKLMPYTDPRAKDLIKEWRMAAGK